MNSHDDAGNHNPESDVSSEDNDNADDLEDHLGELDDKSDRLGNEEINDQLSEISSSMASTD